MRDNFLVGIVYKEGKAYDIVHNYLGRDINNDRIDDIGFVSQGLSKESVSYVIYGAPSKKSAISLAKKMFMKGVMSGYYYYDLVKKALNKL